MHRGFENPRIAALADDLRQDRLSGDQLELELKKLTPEDCLALFDHLAKLESVRPNRRSSPKPGPWDRDDRGNSGYANK